MASVYVPLRASLDSSLSTNFCTLPLAVNGNRSTTRKNLGTLKCASSVRHSASMDSMTAYGKCLGHV